MRKQFLKFITIIICILMVFFGGCSNNSDSSKQTQNSNDKEDITTEESNLNTEAIPDEDADLSFGYLDRDQFSFCLSNGVFRCGSDFDPGEYYIMSIYGANAYYDVSDDSNDFGNRDRRVLRKISAKKGQYIKLLSGALLVPCKEIDSNNYSKYGIFIVGKDIQEGVYKITRISKHYDYGETRTSGVGGGCQINNKSIDITPETCLYIHEDQNYITLKNGQYIILANAQLKFDSYE